MLDQEVDGSFIHQVGLDSRCLHRHLFNKDTCQQHKSFSDHIAYRTTSSTSHIAQNNSCHGHLHGVDRFRIRVHAKYLAGGFSWLTCLDLELNLSKMN